MSEVPRKVLLHSLNGVEDIDEAYKKTNYTL